MARIKSWGKRKGAGRLQCSGRWRQGRSRAELAGVLSNNGSGLGFRWEKHWEQERDKGNSPSDFTMTEVGRCRRTARRGGREPPATFGGVARVTEVEGEYEKGLDGFVAWTRCPAQGRWRLRCSREGRSRRRFLELVGEI